jgi:SAM-dependent methyltransferase
VRLNKTHHANVKFNGRDESRISGIVFELTEAELSAADEYEHADGYSRELVTLASGKTAWVYTHGEGQSRLIAYHELADWWPLFSPPEHYDEEAADLLQRLRNHGVAIPATLLELGSGGGSLASHLKPHFVLTLTDRSDGMLAVNRRINPEAEHIVGDMRTIRLNRTFDVVVIHDAIMYATDVESLSAAIRTAAVHCKPGGTVVVLPDFVRETFTSGTDDGGEDAPDGRGLRYLEWRWDPNPNDDTYQVDYAFLLRDADGSVRAIHDRHVEGLFSRDQWLECFKAAGLEAASTLDQWGRDVFVASKVR